MDLQCQRPPLCQLCHKHCPVGRFGAYLNNIIFQIERKEERVEGNTQKVNWAEPDWPCQTTEALAASSSASYSSFKTFSKNFFVQISFFKLWLRKIFAQIFKQ